MYLSPSPFEFMIFVLLILIRISAIIRNKISSCYSSVIEKLYVGDGVSSNIYMDMTAMNTQRQSADFFLYEFADVIMTWQRFA